MFTRFSCSFTAMMFSIIWYNVHNLLGIFFPNPACFSKVVIVRHRSTLIGFCLSKYQRKCDSSLQTKRQTVAIACLSIISDQCDNKNMRLLLFFIHIIELSIKGNVEIQEDVFSCATTRNICKLSKKNTAHLRSFTLTTSVSFKSDVHLNVWGPFQRDSKNLRRKFRYMWRQRWKSLIGTGLRSKSIPFHFIQSALINSHTYSTLQSHKKLTRN